MTGNRTAIWIVLGLWAVAMALSGLALTAEPTGDGFTRGLNRVTGFVGWQVPGLILAVVAWLASRPLPRGDLLRWLGRVPGWWTMFLVVAITALIVGSSIVANRPPPVTAPPVPSPPVTAPLE